MIVLSRAESVARSWSTCEFCAPYKARYLSSVGTDPEPTRPFIGGGTGAAGLLYVGGVQVTCETCTWWGSERARRHVEERVSYLFCQVIPVVNPFRAFRLVPVRRQLPFNASDKGHVISSGGSYGNLGPVPH